MCAFQTFILLVLPSDVAGNITFPIKQLRAVWTFVFWFLLMKRLLMAHKSPICWECAGAVVTRE
jgi:hypothetical protein